MSQLEILRELRERNFLISHQGNLVIAFLRVSQRPNWMQKYWMHATTDHSFVFGQETRTAVLTHSALQPSPPRDVHSQNTASGTYHSQPWRTDRMKHTPARQSTTCLPPSTRAVALLSAIEQAPSTRLARMPTAMALTTPVCHEMGGGEANGGNEGNQVRLSRTATSHKPPPLSAQ
jgi:hypothetical protein